MKPVKKREFYDPFDIDLYTSDANPGFRRTGWSFHHRIALGAAQRS
jgi:hypothetical protein